MTGPHEHWSHEHWEELAAGHALDALEPAEEAELMAHVEECETCRAALSDHEFVAAQLGALADDADLAPPAWSAMRTRIVGSATAAVSADDVVDLTERRAARSRRPLVLTGFAAAFILVTALSVVFAVRGGPSATTSAIKACRAEAGCHVVDLSRGSDQRAVALVRTGGLRLLPTHLSSPGTGKVYALWQLPRSGRPTLLAQPVPSASGSPAALKLPYDETAGFALSVEPAGAQATSPTTVVAIGSVTT